MSNLTSAIRKAFVAKLTGDATLTTLCGGTVRVSYRPTRKPLQLPVITMFDFADRADPIVPLWDRNHQLDVWSDDLDKAEEIAQRIKQLFDNGSGLPLPGDEGLMAYTRIEGELDGTQEDSDLIRKTLRIRVLSYDYVTTY